MAINERTGLREEPFVHLGVPLVRQKGVGSFDVRGQLRAAHEIPIPGAPHPLHVYTSTQRSTLLVVLFCARTGHARERGVPDFELVREFNTRCSSLIVADPTLTEKGYPGWFLGGETYDPVAATLQLIPKVRSKSGAETVVFIGHGSGGHAALRALAMVDDATAVVVDPHVEPSLSNLSRASAQAYTDGWGSEDRARDLARTRLNILDAYRDMPPKGRLRVLQSISSAQPLGASYTLLKNLYLIAGAQGRDITGRKEFMLDDHAMTSLTTSGRLLRLLDETLAAEVNVG